MKQPKYKLSYRRDITASVYDLIYKEARPDFREQIGALPVTRREIAKLAKGGVR
jgi:hypothetical protein